MFKRLEAQGGARNCWCSTTSSWGSETAEAVPRVAGGSPSGSWRACSGSPEAFARLATDISATAASNQSLTDCTVPRKWLPCTSRRLTDCSTSPSSGWTSQTWTWRRMKASSWRTGSREWGPTHGDQGAGTEAGQETIQAELREVHPGTHSFFSTRFTVTRPAKQFCSNITVFSEDFLLRLPERNLDSMLMLADQSSLPYILLKESTSSREDIAQAGRATFERILKWS